jgi:mRNA interferase MazF
MPSKPKYGEIWWIAFEPQVGSEIMKTRPGLVVSIDEMGALPTRMVVPIRDYRDNHLGLFFMVPASPTKKNGLAKDSTIDCAQVKSFDLSRFQKKIGKLEEEEFKEVIAILAKCIGYI